MEDGPTNAKSPNRNPNWFGVRPAIAAAGALAVIVGLGGFLLSRWQPDAGVQWKPVHIDAVFPPPLSDQSGNTAFFYEPVNSVIIMAAPRPSIEVSPLINDDEGRPAIYWGTRENVTTVPFIRDTLLIRLPDGKEGRFPIPAGFAMRFVRSYRYPEPGRENSMLQNAINLFDDPAARSRAERFLGDFRGQHVNGTR